jgi:multiple sugar transport system substrate-binding protein
VSTPELARRGFLRLAGGAALMATGLGCSSNSGKARNVTTATTRSGARAKGPLRIAQWNHYVAGYDRWWDQEYTKGWGERHGIEVVVDHFDINQVPAHAEAEVASQRGHDIFHLNLALAATFEDHVIDHREIVEEVQARFGKMPAFVERSILNRKTGKYFGFSAYWTPNPVHYRTDLWGPAGLRPATWEDVLAGGQRLKAQGHPIGIGMGLDAESNVTLLGLMHAFGASIQDEDANVVINRPSTVEAVKMGSALFRAAMTDDVLNWDITSNNRYLIAGRGSLIVNAIAAIRALEAQDPALAAKVGLLPAPAGPAGAASPYIVSVYFIWKFSENQEAAKQFLVDLAVASREPFLQSQFLQIPTFPGTVADLPSALAADARAQPPGKYALLADAADWSTNVGHPGHSNAAMEEVIKASVISQMFAAAARGDMTAEDSVRAAEAEIKPIYDKWRERGKI